MTDSALKKALKIVICLGAFFILIMLILSLAGIAPLKDYNGYYTFGFGYHTDYCAVLLAFALSYIVITDGYMTWKGIAVLCALDIWLFLLHGRTSFLCLLIMILFLSARRLQARREGRVPGTGVLKAITRIMIFSFPLFAAANIILVLTYRKLQRFWDMIPGLGTFKDRLIYAALAFDEYPLTMTGTFIPRTPGEVNGLYFTIDSGYIRILLEHGLMLFSLFMLITTAVQAYNYRKGNVTGLSVMTVMALSFVMEYQIFSLLLLTAYLLGFYCDSSKRDPDMFLKKHLREDAGFIVKILCPLCLVLAAALAVLSGISQSLSGESGEAVIVVDIGVRSGSFENGVADIEDRLRLWEMEHPQYEIRERDRIRDWDFVNLAVMGTDHLPDIFIADYYNGEKLAVTGSVKDISDIDPAHDGNVFTVNGSIYAFSVEGIPGYDRMDYGIFINEGLEGDRLDDCVDLAWYLSGSGRS